MVTPQVVDRLKSWNFITCLHIKLFIVNYRALGLDATFNVSEDGEGAEQANPNSSPFARLMDGKKTKDVII